MRWVRRRAPLVDGRILCGFVAAAAGTMVLPLALAQFIASYAATNMNVAISAIASDLHTTLVGVQRAARTGSLASIW